MGELLAFVTMSYLPVCLGQPVRVSRNGLQGKATCLQEKKKDCTRFLSTYSLNQLLGYA